MNLKKILFVVAVGLGLFSPQRSEAQTSNLPTILSATATTNAISNWVRLHIIAGTNVTIITNNGNLTISVTTNAGLGTFLQISSNLTDLNNRSTAASQIGIITPALNQGNATNTAPGFYTFGVAGQWMMDFDRFLWVASGTSVGSWRGDIGVGGIFLAGGLNGSTGEHGFRTTNTDNVAYFKNNSADKHSVVYFQTYTNELWGAIGLGNTNSSYHYHNRYFRASNKNLLTWPALVNKGSDIIDAIEGNYMGEGGHVAHIGMAYIATNQPSLIPLADANELDYYILKYKSLSAFGEPALYVDGRRGILKFETTGTNSGVGQGLISILGTTVHGSNTAFLSGTNSTNRLKVGDMISIGNTNFHVVKITTDTNAIVSEPTTGLSYTSYSIYSAAARFLSQDQGRPFSAADSGGNLIAYTDGGVTSLTLQNGTNGMYIRNDSSLMTIGTAYGNNIVNPIAFFYDSDANALLIDHDGKAGHTNGGAFATSFALPIGSPTAGQVWTATASSGAGAWSNAAAGSGLSSLTMPPGFQTNGSLTAPVVTFSTYTNLANTNFDLAGSPTAYTNITGATAFQLTNEPNTTNITFVLRVFNNTTANTITISPSSGRTNYWIGAVANPGPMDNARCVYTITTFSNENLIGVTYYK